MWLSVTFMVLALGRARSLDCRQSRVRGYACACGSACVCMCACGRVHSLCEHKIHHTLAVALTVTHSLCDERTRTHEVYRCTVHSRHQGPRGTHAQLLPSRRALLARHALCVSALRLGAARLYESRAPALGATAATACSLPAATGARRVAVRRLLLMLLPRRAVVPARGGTQLEGVGDRRAGSLSPRQTPLRVSAAAAASPRE